MSPLDGAAASPLGPNASLCSVQGLAFGKGPLLCITSSFGHWAMLSLPWSKTLDQAIVQSNLMITRPAVDALHFVFDVGRQLRVRSNLCIDGVKRAAKQLLMNSPSLLSFFLWG